MSGVVVDKNEDTKKALTTLGDHITLIMDSAKKDILRMLDTRIFLLTNPDYLRANSRYQCEDILRDHDHLRAKLPPPPPLSSLPPLPVVAGKNHTRRHKKKRGKKTRNRRKY